MTTLTSSFRSQEVEGSFTYENICEKDKEE